MTSFDEERRATGARTNRRIRILMREKGGAEGKEVATKGAGKESPSEIDKRGTRKVDVTAEGVERRRTYTREKWTEVEEKEGRGPRGVH